MSFVPRPRMLTASLVALNCLQTLAFLGLLLPSVAFSLEAEPRSSVATVELTTAQPEKVLGEEPSSLESYTSPPSTNPQVSPIKAEPSYAYDINHRLEKISNDIAQIAATQKAATSDEYHVQKTILLNVLSNRIDALLFGNGSSGGVGAAAYFVALFAFAIALLRLTLAKVHWLGKSERSRFSEFSIRLRDSYLSRFLGVIFGWLAVLYTGAALYVVHQSRAASDSSAEVVGLQHSLQECMAAQESAFQRLAETASPPSQQERRFVEIEQGILSCKGSAESLAPQLSELKNSVDQAIPKKSMLISFIGGLISLIVWIVVLAALAYLTIRALREDGVLRDS